MRALICPGTYDCLNLGDVAMLQVAANRFQRLAPDWELNVITRDEARLARHCPAARPVSDRGRRIWLSDQLLLGGLHRRLSDNSSALLQRTKRRLRLAAPGLIRRATHVRMALTRGCGADIASMYEFLEAFERADLLFVAGQSTLTDSFPGHARITLDTIEIASARGLPSFLSGQGIGPICDPELMRRARDVLPAVDRLALREQLLGPALLRRMGVDPAKAIVTGDDAVELAYEERPPDIGWRLGVNLRLGGPAGKNDHAVAVLRNALKRFHHGRPVEFIGAPIALHEHARDPQTIRDVLQPWAETVDRGVEPDSPLEVIHRLGTCRVLVTGAYHAAVFALSQGVPTICLWANDYYDAKFRGLKDLFGSGCSLFELNGDDLEARLLKTLEQTWEGADTHRPSLIAAARCQTARGEQAFREMLHRWNPISAQQPLGDAAEVRLA